MYQIVNQETKVLLITGFRAHFKHLQGSNVMVSLVSLMLPAWSLESSGWSRQVMHTPVNLTKWWPQSFTAMTGSLMSPWVSFLGFFLHIMVLITNS